MRPVMQIGDVFAERFKVVRVVTLEGGQGAVYAVEDRNTGKVRALKTLPPHMVGTEEARRRFEQEVIAASRVKSSHVVEVFDRGVDARGVPWLLMELLEGMTLHDRVTGQGPFLRGEALTVFRQLGHALERAHEAGVLHLDLKPANVFLARSGGADDGVQVKVLDFGIARLVEAQRTAVQASRGAGTPEWMAPEQFGAGELRASADVWALGLLAFYGLTGKEYWKTQNVAATQRNSLAVMGEVLSGQATAYPAASLRAKEMGVGERIPSGFDAWFARCLVWDASARYRNAKEAVPPLVDLLNVWVLTPPAVVDTARKGPPPTVRGEPSVPIGAASHGAPPTELMPTLPQGTSDQSAKNVGRTPGSLRTAGTLAGAAALVLSVLAVWRPWQESAQTSAQREAAQPARTTTTSASSETPPDATDNREPPSSAPPRGELAETSLGGDGGSGSAQSPPARVGTDPPRAERRRSDRRVGGGGNLLTANHPPSAQRAQPERGSIGDLLTSPTPPPSPPAPASPPSADDLPERPTRSQITSALTPLNGAVRQCAGGQTGTAPVEITWGSDGTVRSASVRGIFAGTPVGQCIADVVRRARVSPFRTSQAQVTWPFVILPLR